MSVVSMIQVAVAFVWLGMVLGISFLEAPLKFRAPGISIPLGVGIGRLVFRALNIVEGVFALALIVTAAIHPSGPAALPYLVAAVAVVLGVGALALRPRMDRRVRAGDVSDGRPRHMLHFGYVGLECLKVALLIAIGITAFAG